MSEVKPLIMFVDDEPHNLAVFEAAIPETWEVKVYDSPLTAIEKVAELQPWVIVSDQRMPGMKGVKFLELAGKLNPSSVRILVTGYTDEDLIIESVRAAKIFDYIRKPWDVEELVKRLEAGIDYHKAIQERENMEKELRQREKELRAANAELVQTSLELERSFRNVEELSKELSCWVPPVVTWLAKTKAAFPLHRDLAVMAIDIVGSGAIHGKQIGNKSLRAQILEEFAILVLKHGGYVESTEGDASYANFGLSDRTERPCDAAFAVATEFRAALRGISAHHHQTVECGIAMHFAAQCQANISEYTVSTSQGVIVQKKFYTSSSDIDLVHRMEKFTHQLPGTNIVMSKDFYGHLSNPPDSKITDIGSHLFKGQTKPVDLVLIKSDLAKDEQIQQIIPKAS
ncbi:MAG: response regulator [Bdellovibrionales bacterium]